MLMFCKKRHTNYKILRMNISSLCAEIKNHTNAEDSKQFLLMIDWIFNPIGDRAFKFIYNGLYDKALEEIDKVKEDAAAVVDYLHKIGFCLKELRYYDEALELLLIDSEEVKVNIACCFILRGEIEKGIKLFGSLTKLNVENLIEIGRALYDVRWYAKSEEYFSQYFTKVVAERR